MGEQTPILPLTGRAFNAAVGRQDFFQPGTRSFAIRRTGRPCGNCPPQPLPPRNPTPKNPALGPSQVPQLLRAARDWGGALRDA